MSIDSHSLASDDRGILRDCPVCGQTNRIAFEKAAGAPRCAKCHRELGPVSEPVQIGSRAAFDGLISRTPLPILVDFWAAWCGPCRMIAPEVARAAQIGASRWIVAKVDTEALPDVAGRYRVTSLPTLALFQGGAELERQAGAISSPAIVRFIENALLKR